MDTSPTGIVAHFYLAGLNHRSYDKNAAEITFQVVGNAQNKTWAAATPAGQLTMTVKNPAAARQFTLDDLGCEYEVTIRKITPTA